MIEVLRSKKSAAVKKALTAYAEELPDDAVLPLYVFFRYAHDAKHRKTAGEILKKHGPAGVGDMVRQKLPMAKCKADKLEAYLALHQGSGLDPVELAFECMWWARKRPQMAKFQQHDGGLGAAGLFGHPDETVRRRALEFLVEGGSLKLADQALTALPDELAEFTDLHTVDLRMNKFSKSRYPAVLGRLPNLRKLLLTGNGMSGLPSQFSQLNLEELDLWGNPLKKDPTPLASMKSLRRLNLGSTKLTSFPSSILELPDLEALEVQYNAFTDVPVEIARLTKLRKLVLPKSAKKAAVGVRQALPDCNVKVDRY